jgi:hypothetical protein
MCDVAAIVRTLISPARAKLEVRGYVWAGSGLAMTACTAVERQLRVGISSCAP